MSYGYSQRPAAGGGATPAGEPPHRTRAAPSTESARLERQARRGGLEEDALSKGQNLLGTDAGDEKVGGTYQVTLADARLAEGDVVSAAADVKGANATDVWDLAIRFLDGAAAVLDTVTGSSTAGATYTRQRCHAARIPAGTVTLEVLAVANGGVVGTATTRRAMLTRGPRALAFEEPPFRATRETLDEILDGLSFRKVIDVDANGRVTANSLAINELAAISQVAGIIVSGLLRNAANDAGLDLDASGAEPFLYHPALQLLANGNADFGGTVSAEQFSAASISFGGVTGGSSTLRWWDIANLGLEAQIIGSYDSLLLQVIAGAMTLSATQVNLTGGLNLNAAGVAPAVTGSRGGNAALASLLTVLASQGLITNNSAP